MLAGLEMGLLAVSGISFAIVIKLMHKEVKRIKLHKLEESKTLR